MTHKKSPIDGRYWIMTMNFLAKRRITAECEHASRMCTEIAGMRREVCESCGRVSVAYIEDHFHPDRIHEVEVEMVDSDDPSSSDDASSDDQASSDD